MSDAQLPSGESHLDPQSVSGQPGRAFRHSPAVILAETRTVYRIAGKRRLWSTAAAAYKHLARDAFYRKHECRCADDYCVRHAREGRDNGHGEVMMVDSPPMLRWRENVIARLARLWMRRDRGAR